MSINQGGPQKGFNPMMAMFAAYGKLFSNIPGFMFLAATPVGLTLGIQVLKTVWPGNPQSFFFFFGSQLLESLFVVSFAVSWLRYCRFGTFNKIHPFLLPIGHREGRIFLVYFLMYTPLFIVFFQMLRANPEQISGANGLLFTIILVTTIFVATRLSLIFPAIAQDRGDDLKQIWARTRGQFFGLILAIVVSGLPFIPILMALGLFAGSGSTVGMLFAFTMVMVLNYMMVAIVFGILDNAYHSLGGGNLPATSAGQGQRDKHDGPS